MTITSKYLRISELQTIKNKLDSGDTNIYLPNTVSMNSEYFFLFNKYKNLTVHINKNLKELIFYPLKNYIKFDWRVIDENISSR